MVTIPKSAFKLGSVFTLKDDFACKCEIAIKPSAPQTTAIRHYVHLVIAQSVELATRSNLEARRVGMATNNLKCGNWILTALKTCQKCANCRAITLEEVSFACLKCPLLRLLELNETALSKRVCAPVHRVEVALAVCKPFKNMLSIRLTFCQKRVAQLVRCLYHKL